MTWSKHFRRQSFVASERTSVHSRCQVEPNPWLRVDLGREAGSCRIYILPCVVRIGKFRCKLCSCGFSKSIFSCCSRRFRPAPGLPPKRIVLFVFSSSVSNYFEVLWSCFLRVARNACRAGVQRDAVRAANAVQIVPTKWWNNPTQR